MHNSKSRVGIFMAVGIVIAIVVGVFVWNTSSSEHSAQAGYVSATDTQAPRKESPIAKTSKATSRSASKSPSLIDAPSSAPPRPHSSAPQAQINLDTQSSQRTAQQRDYNLNSDPYAPQHAVVGTPQEQPATRVFRPTNVVPTTVMATTAAGGPTADAGAPGSGTGGAGSASGSGDSSGASVGTQDGGEPNHPSTSTAGAPRPDETGESATGAPTTEPTATAPTPAEDGGDGGDTDGHSENAPRPTRTADPMALPDGAAPQGEPSPQHAADGANAEASASTAQTAQPAQPAQTGGAAAATGASEAASLADPGAANAAQVVETPRELVEQGVNHAPAPEPAAKKSKTPSTGFSSDALQAWNRFTRPFQR